MAPPELAVTASACRRATVLDGPVRGAVVLGVFAAGAYLRVHSDDAAAESCEQQTVLLPVVGRQAVALPGSVVVPDPEALRRVSRLVVGARAKVGDGRVVLPGLRLEVVRRTPPPCVRVRTAPDGLLAALRLRADLPRGALSDDAGAVALALAGGGDAVAEMLRLAGAGPGLTPAGDDALAGVLLLCWAAGFPAGLDLVRQAGTRTTLLSAHLLTAAARGEAAAVVVALVEAVLHGEPDRVRRALGPVLALGHTSGADLVEGLRGALDALAAGGRVAA